MGRIARVLQNIKHRINMNLGGGYNNECEHAQPLGEDSRPLPDDNGVVTKTGTSGNFTAFGFFDYQNKIANPGEKRGYARSAGGEVVSHVYQKNSGAVEIMNDEGFAILQADGIFNINGFLIYPDGSTSCPTTMASPSFVADGKELTEHKHPIESGSSAPGPTGGNI